MIEMIAGVAVPVTKEPKLGDLIAFKTSGPMMGVGIWLGSYLPRLHAYMCALDGRIWAVTSSEGYNVIAAYEDAE